MWIVEVIVVFCMCDEVVCFLILVCVFGDFEEKLLNDEI